MGSLKKFIRKTYKAVVPIVGGLVAGPVGASIGGMIANPNAKSQPAPQDPIYQTLPAPPPPPAPKKKKASKLLEPKMDLAPGLTKTQLLVGGAAVAATVALLASRGK